MGIFSKKQMIPQPQGLVSVLLDEYAPFGDRDDAAMDLGAYDEPEAEEALFSVACRPDTDRLLTETCGESLGEIWSWRGSLNRDGLMKLDGVAKEFALGVIKARRPEWQEQIQEC